MFKARKIDGLIKFVHLRAALKISSRCSRSVRAKRRTVSSALSKSPRSVLLNVS